ncbi:FAD-dependent oxidoreductase [Burkholderia sp. Ac-20353]|nr:FAD-dependent oxidoreductase [Burkholderia sp. Ac-20353]
MKVAVIGAGPAGCTAAYTLRKHGHEVSLFESQDHVGGRTSQVHRDGFNLGSGALFLMGGNLSANAGDSQGDGPSRRSGCMGCQDACRRLGQTALHRGL